MAEFKDDIVLDEVLPFSLEAEQAILGGMLVDPDCISTVMGYITTGDMFYKTEHAKIFNLFIKMFNFSQNIDFITFLDEVNSLNIFDSDNDAKRYLVLLMDIVPSVSNIKDYCEIVRDKYYKRRLINIAKEITYMTKEGDATAEQLMDMAEQKLYDIRKGKTASSLKPISDVIMQTFENLRNLSSEDRDKFLGLSTGFDRLDAMMTGLNKSDLILLAARPGMGKTSFALNVATNVAKKYDKDIAVFSLEMSNEQLVSRVLSSEAQVPSEALKTGKLSSDQWTQLISTAEILMKTNIYLSETPSVGIAEIKSMIRRLKNLGLIVIDYLQLMSGGGKNENRVQEISKLTRNLKIMAKEFNVPIILLSQLNRSAEQREGHKPMLSDLRESGSIEQDADIVMFLFREGYYNKEVEHPYISQCILAKNRHGSTGEVDLRWDGQFTKFANLEMNRVPPPF